MNYSQRNELIAKGIAEGVIKVEKDYEIEDSYIHFLNESYGEIDICGTKYEAAQAFKDVDPVAYDLGLSEYISHDYEEVNGGYVLTQEVEEYLEEVLNQ